MAPDDRTVLLEYLPSKVVRDLITLLTEEDRKINLRLLGFPEFSVGRLMTPDYINVRESCRVKDVLDYISAHGKNRETLNITFSNNSISCLFKLLDKTILNKF